MLPHDATIDGNTTGVRKKKIRRALPMADRDMRCAAMKAACEERDAHVRSS